MAVDNSDYNNISLEDKRALAKEYNQEPLSYPERTQPVAPTSVPGMYDSADIPLPDYQSRLQSSSSEIPNIKNEVVRLTRGSYSAELAAGNPYSALEAGKPQYEMNPYGTPVNITESHESDRNGVWRSKYPYFRPGLDNEDYFARSQGTWDKIWKGVGKFAIKSVLYGTQGVISIPDKIAAVAREGTLKAALSTDTDKFFDDLDAMTDRTFAHYYRAEARDYNLGQKMIHDTGNFIWNDVIGSGMSFTVGAMLTAYATGGLGLASLGNLGAKAGMRVGMNIAAREASRKGVGALKSVFNQYVRKSIATGRTIGNIAQNTTILATSAGFESAFEARNYLKESEADFKNYYRNIHGREPSFEELSAFRETNNSVAGGIFAANMGIVGLSNWMLFGKYVGVGGKVLPKASQWVNNKMFGLGTEVVKPGEMAIKITNPNIGQKLAANIFNITKRPLSEGVWEEGTQGVVQNAAEEYVKSRYDETSLKNVAGALEAIGDGFVKQYTTKEGWNEIGIGAIIGGLFGARSGMFGIKEYSNSRNQLEAQVNVYNTTVSNLNTAALNTVKRAMSLGPQVKSDANTITDEEFDEAVFSKMSIENELGLLEDSSETFRKMMEHMPVEEIAESNNMTLDQAKEYKDMLVEDYNRRLSDFKISSDFAENIIGDEGQVEFKRYLSHNVFLGLQSGQRMRDIADKIAEVSEHPDVAPALNLFSDLNKQAVEAAKRLKSVKEEITAIEKEIEDVATRPRNVDGVDPQAEEIQRKTGDLNTLQEEYSRLSSELAYLSNKEFSVYDLDRSTRDVTSNGILPISVEEMTAAYESLLAFDNYLGRKKESELTAKDRAVKKMVEQYRMNLVRYRNMNNTLAKMSDTRFLRKEQKGFSKLLSDMIGTRYERSNETPEYIDPGQLQGYASDEVVDNALAEGKITEDEAFSIKAFMHSLDQVRKKESQEEESFTIPVVETVSDEDYNNAMNNAIAPSVLDSITNKIRNNQNNIFTPRESEIYDANKDEIDSHVLALGDNPLSMIDRLKKKVERFLHPDSVLDQNQFVIDLAREKLSPEDRDRLDEAISRYKDLQNKLEDGEDVDQDEILDNMITISDLGQVGNISDLLPYIDQNRLIERGKVGADTVTDLSNEEQVSNALNEYEPDNLTPGANTDSLQNPEILMVRKKQHNLGTRYEFSGLQAGRFVKRLKSSLPIDVKSKKEKGLTRYEITINGETIYLKELPSHARFDISEEGVEILNKYTNIQVGDASLGYTMIWDVTDPNAPMPFRTEVGFGRNETEKIDQEALAAIKVGDDVQLEIDTNDDYNQLLINEYSIAEESGNEKKIDKAKERLVSELVIRVMKDGKLVSVVKSTYNDNIPNLRSLRIDAYNKMLEANSGTTIVQLGNRKIVQALPGRPVFNLNLSEGSTAVENKPVTEKGSKKIVNVGYILDGEVVLKKKGDYRVFPFANSFVRNRDGQYDKKRIPVVVIEGRNGENYVYPVTLKEIANEESELYYDIIGELLDPAYDLTNVPQSTIQDINRYLTSIGLDPASYQISFLDPAPGLRKAKEAILSNGMSPNVERWITDNRTPSEIAVSDIDINIDLESEVFIAPKIRINLSETPAEEVVADEPTSGTESIPDSTPSSNGGEVTSDMVSDTSTENAEVSDIQTVDNVPTKRRFDKKLTELEKVNNGEPANAFDFIARSLASGSLKFLAKKGNSGDIRVKAGLPVDSRKTRGITALKGLTLDNYINWLKSQKNEVVYNYLSTRSDEQVKLELLAFLERIDYVPVNALNYSLTVNKLEPVLVSTTKDEVDKIQSDINSMVSQEVPEVTALVEEVIEDDLPFVVPANSVNESMTDNTEEPVSSTETEPAPEEPSTSQEESQPAPASTQTEEPAPAPTKPVKSGGKRKPRVLKESNIIDIIKEANNALPEGERMNDQEILQFITDMKAVYEAEGAGKFNTEEFAKQYNEFIKQYRDGQRSEQKSNDVRPTEISTEPSTEEGKGQSGAAEETSGDGRVSGSADIVPETPFIQPESAVSLLTVQVDKFVFGGESAYTNVPGKVTELRESTLKNNKIKKGKSVAQLVKEGYKRVGLNWIYSFNNYTGEYDMYNISSAEAFRIKPNQGIKITNRELLLSLEQSYRNIANFDNGLAYSEQERISSLVDKSNNESAEKELKKEC